MAAHSRENTPPPLLERIQLSSRGRGIALLSSSSTSTSVQSIGRGILGLRSQKNQVRLPGEDQPETSRPRRPAAENALTSLWSAAGKGRHYLHLQEALQAAAETDDNVVVIPPDGSDMEDFDEDETAPHPPTEVSGYLEILHESEDLDDIPREWRKRHSLDPIPDGDPVQPLSCSHPMLADKSPCEIFLLFFTPTMAEKICEESIRFARQLGDFTFTMTTDDLMKFVAIILWTGYVVLPRVKLYWDTDEDCDLPFPCKMMSRDRFLMIKRYLHFANNDYINTKENRFAKVQFLFDELNKNLVQFGIFESDLSVDEQMVRYTGRHPQKQFMKNKPVRWGFKNFVLSTSSGYPLYVLPYQGRKRDKTTPLTIEVVMTMAAVIRDNSDLRQHALYMDNFYTSWKLLSLLHNLHLGATGTVRANRINKCPLATDKALEGRGDFDYQNDGKVLFVKWNDKTTVIIGTNFDTVDPVNNVKRWGKDGLKVIPAPHCVKSYNAHMGGVDLTNRFIEEYHPSVTGKKWYWCQWINILGLCRVAAWRVSISARNLPQQEPSLTFLRTLVKQLASLFGPSVILEPQRRGHGGALCVMKEGLHVTVPSEKQGRCQVCRKNTRRMCAICKVLVHDDCMNSLHGKSS
jgi:hypothetical protein